MARSPTPVAAPSRRRAAPPPATPAAKPAKAAKPPEPVVTVSATDEDLELLFDRVSAERSAAPQSPPPCVDPTKPAQPEAAPDEFDVFQRVGALTRRLHDALRELGYDKTVEEAVGTLPDARTRLAYIANLTGQAAEKVLGAVEQGQGLQEGLEMDARELSESWERLMAGRMSVEEFRELALHTREFLGTMPERTARTNAVFTEIMVAQDFHDLTGQVIQRVVKVAQTLEEQLVKLLLDTTPPERRTAVKEEWLSGPAVETAGRDDVVTSQAQVDDLLESLGF
jgi:chemotaxis protein CheZ